MCSICFINLIKFVLPILVLSLTNVLCQLFESHSYFGHHPLLARMSPPVTQEEKELALFFADDAYGDQIFVGIYPYFPVASTGVQQYVECLITPDCVSSDSRKTLTIDTKLLLLSLPNNGMSSYLWMYIYIYNLFTF